jgi:type II secretory pathway component PulK
MLLRTPSAGRPRRGFVLLAVLVALVILSLVAYQYSDLTNAEMQAVDAHARAQQARGFADSGIAYVAAMLADPDFVNNQLNGNFVDNPEFFQDVAVGGEDTRPGWRGRFSIVSLRNPDDPLLENQPYRFGLCDESRKLNLNSMMALANTDPVRLQMLQMLPNMTSDQANAVLDWLDGSTTVPRSGGGKDEYYGALQPTYRCKNGPLDSLDELLMVKGITPPLLYGNDFKRNGTVDPAAGDSSGQLDLGWQAYLTIYSRETNVDGSGNPRIFLNDQDLNNLKQNLSTAGVSDDLIQFIIAFRLYGAASTGTGGGAGGQTGPQKNPDGTLARVAAGPQTSQVQKMSAADSQAVQTQIQNDLANTQRRLNSIGSLSDLITKSVTVQVQQPGGQGGQQNQTRSVTYPSPLADPGQQATLLPVLFDKCTTKNQGELPAHINVNTAPQVVLSMLPGLADSEVQSILDNQPDPTQGAPDPVYQTPAWLITKANLAPSKLSGVESYVTARSQVYRFQVVGYFEDGGPTARVEVVIDANNGRPRVLYRRDLSDLGRGFNFGQQQGPQQ